MSVQLIRQYQAEVAKAIRVTKSHNESTLRPYFFALLNHYARPRNLGVYTEKSRNAPNGDLIRPDGVLMDDLTDWGFWESKDVNDKLDKEIAAKVAKGYPTSNILFENTQTAVLIQGGEEVGRVPFKEVEALDKLLVRFVSYESQEVRDFRESLLNFTRDVPGLSQELRQTIENQFSTNPAFRQAATTFLELCQKAINPSVGQADVREMIIQHILTQDIFTSVFDDAEFHQDNNIAQELGRVVGTFYSGETRRKIQAGIRPYYQVINARAAQIADHHEKQKFLKVLYETFYKAYNPKGADRLGIVYTPSEIVRFMIEATDHLLFAHFGKTLGSEGVEILDPATGTGTFITEIIDYLPEEQLPHKYRHELHANEVAILPYYIANLNIEYTYKQKMGAYAEFANICFVDTLDNLGFGFVGKQTAFSFALAEENMERIKRQNERKISVIIGNPPYNANQRNENENNKNREYSGPNGKGGIDQRIRETYVKHSTAQKTNVYDMYTRFYRWASDRLGDEGMIALITNRSFIDARGYDGFRKVVGEEFSQIYVVDLGGDVRQNPKLSGPKNNVFAIQTGVAICFLIKKPKTKGLPAQIFYTRRPEMEEAAEKLRFLSANRFKQLPFTFIQPDKTHNWINQIENSWDNFLPIVLSNRESNKAPTIFELDSNGINTSRDEWVYDLSLSTLEEKASFFIDEYNHEVNRWIAYKKDRNYEDIRRESNPIVDDFLHARNIIKWSKMIKRDKLRKEKLGTFNQSNIRKVLYRPFFMQYFYCDYIPIDLFGQQLEMFPNSQSTNFAICFSGQSSSKPFQVLSVTNVAGYDLLEKTRCVSLYRYDGLGNRQENITDWALAQFQARYGAGGSPTTPPDVSSPDASSPDASSLSTFNFQLLTKEDIFHYVYAVLHNPAYRTKYEQNLKREFPRIPFYADFWQWAEWGRQLLAWHVGYEGVAPFPLTREEQDPAAVRAATKAKLRADKENGVIEIDTLTRLSGVPTAVWGYKLGNRTAVEWVLDRTKESTPKDPTIRERFNNYHFSDYKEQVIELLAKVVTVSVETMAIIEQMKSYEL